MRNFRDIVYVSFFSTLNPLTTADISSSASYSASFIGPRLVYTSGLFFSAGPWKVSRVKTASPCTIRTYIYKGCRSYPFLTPFKVFSALFSAAVRFNAAVGNIKTNRAAPRRIFNFPIKFLTRHKYKFVNE